MTFVTDKTRRFYEEIQSGLKGGDKDVIQYIHKTVGDLIISGHWELVRELLTVNIWEELPSHCLRALIHATVRNTAPWGEDIFYTEFQSIKYTLRRREHKEIYCI